LFLDKTVSTLESKHIVNTLSVQGMTAAEGYVWFLPGWFTRHWWDTSRYGIGYDGDGVPCTSSEMLSAVQSHFFLNTAYLGPESSYIVGNTTVSDWYNAYNDRLSRLVGLRFESTFYTPTNRVVALPHEPVCPVRPVDSLTAPFPVASLPFVHGITLLEYTALSVPLSLLG
jgi:hypothetical protein